MTNLSHVSCANLYGFIAFECATFNVQCGQMKRLHDFLQPVIFTIFCSHTKKEWNPLRRIEPNSTYFVLKHLSNFVETEFSFSSVHPFFWWAGAFPIQWYYLPDQSNTASSHNKLQTQSIKMT